MTSKVFDWLRFPLIVLIVYAHSLEKPVNYDLIDFTNLMPIDFYNLFRISVGVCLAHVPVPVFFFISGYLFINKLSDWDNNVFFEKLKNRFKTLFVPYMIWNTIFVMVFAYIFFKIGGLHALRSFFGERDITSFYWDYYYWNQTKTDWLGIPTPSSGPFLLSLWYIRDLMVMMVFSPALYFLFKYTRKWGMIILLLSYISSIGLKIPGFSTTAIFFFGLGVYFNLNKINPTGFCSRYRHLIYIVTFILWIIITCFNEDKTPIGNLINPFWTLFCFISFINLATSFVKKGLMIPRFLTRSSFFVYVSHPILITSYCNSLMVRIFGETHVASLTISFILSPILIVAICVLCYQLLHHFLPSICRVLTGNR